MKRFKNNNKVQVNFELRSKKITVEPGAVLEVPDELAYAIPLMQVRLDPVEEKIIPPKPPPPPPPDAKPPPDVK